MVLLHIDLAASATASSTLRVSLGQRFEAQRICLKKSIVVRNKAATASSAVTLQDSQHAVYLRIPWLTHEHVASNHDNARLALSMDPSTKRTESEYHCSFYANEIPVAFDVELFQDPQCRVPLSFHRTTASSAHAHHITDIQLWFELEHAELMA